MIASRELCVGEKKWERKHSINVAVTIKGEGDGAGYRGKKGLVG